MRRRHVLLTLLVLLLAAGAWSAWQVLQVKKDLDDAVSAASVARDAVADGDAAAARAATDRLDAAVSAAADRSSGATFDVLSAAPVLGDDLAAVATVSGALDAAVDDGLRPLVDEADGLDPQTFVPSGGRIDVARIAALAAPLGQAADALASARDDVRTIRTGDLVAALATPVRDLSRDLTSAAARLDAAAAAGELLPGLLGADGARTHLLVLQNNAEVRSLGGLPGATATLRTRDGSLDLVRQVAGSSFGERPRPVLPLTPDERTLFTDKLGTYFLDANLTPDFTRAADLWRARWEETYDDRLASVVAVDAVAISALLAGTGPVTVDGVELTADNAVDELLHRTYLRLPDPLEQDLFFRAVLETVLDRLTSGDGVDARALVGALAEAVDERRVMVHSFDETEQERISAFALSGPWRSPENAGEELGVFLNDGTGSKMSYFLDADVAVRADFCTADEQQFTGRLVLTSDTPDDVRSLPDYVTGRTISQIPVGDQLVIVYVAAPEGGELSELTVDGRDIDPVFVRRLGGRQVAELAAFIKPDTEAVITWRLRTPPTEELDLTVTPGVRSTESRTLGTAC